MTRPSLDLFTVAVYAARAVLEHQGRPGAGVKTPLHFNLYIWSEIGTCPPALSVEFADSYFYELRAAAHHHSDGEPAEHPQTGSLNAKKRPGR